MEIIHKNKLFFVFLFFTWILVWHATPPIKKIPSFDHSPANLMAFADSKKNYRKRTPKRKSLKKKYHRIFSKAIMPKPLPLDLISSRDFHFLLYKNLLEKSKKNLEIITSIRGTLVKRERIKDKLLPSEEIEFIANKDFLFMQWQIGENFQRKLLYRPAMDQDQIWLFQPKGIWRKLNAFQIKNLAKPLFSGNRHLIPKRLGQGIWFGQILEYAIREISLGRNETEFKLTPVKLDFANEHLCYLLKTNAPEEWVKENEDYLPGKENEFYALRSELWLEKNTLLPLKIAIYGKGSEKTGILLESYNFRKIEINPELKIENFAPQHVFSSKAR